MRSSWRTSCSGIPQRWIFVFMAFFGLWLGNALRVILSITITEMVVPVQEIIRPRDDTCVSFQQHILKNVTYTAAKVYDWDEYTQGIILSSYFWGYAATQFLFGSLSERFGGKYPMGFAILIPAILTFLIPLAVEWGEASALIVLRVMMGVTSGAMYPAISTMISQWTSEKERAKFGSIIYAGAILGTIFGTTTPALIMRYLSTGWPVVFYTFGALGMVWFPFWALLCYNNAEEHPYITEAEFKHLEESADRQNRNHKAAAPWKKILTSKPFWAFVVALVGCDWAYFTMASDLPKYMSSVVKFSIENNGYLSSLPYLSMWFSSMACYYLSAKLLDSDCVSKTNARKILATISLMGPAIFIVGASYAGCDQMLVVLAFVLGLTMMGASYPSIMVNALDLSPNYAGTLMAIGNGIAAIGGILTPYIVGVLAPNQTIGEWRLVFWIVVAVALVSTVFFLMFGSGQIQPWNDSNYQQTEKTMEMEKPKIVMIDEEMRM